MPSFVIRVIALLALCAAGAHARDVYKCTTPHGDVAYQDVPCATDSEESRVRVPDDRAATAALAAPAAEPPPIDKPKAAETPRPHKPLPRIWFCQNAENGSVYASRNGPPPPRAVPFGVLGFTGKSLNQAFRAGGNVMSAPELNKPPIDRSPLGSVANNYAQLQDECIEANADQTCAYLRQRLDVTSDKLGHARFKDEQARLQSEVDGLQGDLDGC